MGLLKDGSEIGRIHSSAERGERGRCNEPLDIRAIGRTDPVVCGAVMGWSVRDRHGNRSLARGLSTIDHTAHGWVPPENRGGAGERCRVRPDLEDIILVCV